MDISRVLFLIFSDTEDGYADVEKSLKCLDIPEYVEIECMRIESENSDEFESQMHQAVACPGYEYKVYLRENIEFVNKNFIGNLIEVFKSDSDIAVVGMTGSRYLIEDNGSLVYDDVCDGLNGNFGQVQMVDASVFAVHYRMYWRISMFDSWEQAVASQCMGYIRNGYKIYVPEQSEPWIRMIGNKDYHINNIELSNIFLKEYVYRPCSEKSRLLYSYGQNTIIDSDCRISNPENVWIGNQVRIESDVVLQGSDSSRTSIRFDGNNKIGKGTRIQAKENIYLAQYVSVGQMVELIGYCEIGWGTTIGDGTIIHNAMIGNFVTVEPYSFINKNIPNHCKVAGNPARVTELRDYETGKWIAIHNENQLESELERRQMTKPIFSIGIPTYNRSYYLEKNLKNIIRSIGNDDILSVFISDNCSTDQTEMISKEYENKYKQIYYSRNIENIGALNFKKVWMEAPGRYVLALGDDIYINGEAIYGIVEAIYSNPGCSILGLKYSDNEKICISQCNTADQYLTEISYWITHISNYVFFQDEVKKISWPGYKSFSQIALQFNLLSNNQKAIIIKGKIIGTHSGEQTNGRIEKKTCIEDVFISEYLDVLLKFTGTVVSVDVYRKEKKNILLQFVIPYIREIANRDAFPYTVGSNIYQVLSKYYKDEDYYLNAKKEIEKYVEIMKQKGRVQY